MVSCSEIESQQDLFAFLLYSRFLIEIVHDSLFSGMLSFEINKSVTLQLQQTMVAQPGGGLRWLHPFPLLSKDNWKNASV